MRRKTTLHEKAIEAGRKVEYSDARVKYRKKDVAQKESMRKMHRSYINQLDNLNPVIRWLRSRVGQRWNKVNSELKKELGTGLAAEHIRSHVDQMVERYPTYDKKGLACREMRWGGVAHIVADEFYVDKGGHLREGKIPRASRWSFNWKYHKDLGIIKRGEDTVYVTDHGNFISKPLKSNQSQKQYKYLIREKGSIGKWEFSRKIPPGYVHISGPFRQVA